MQTARPKLLMPAFMLAIYTATISAAIADQDELPGDNGEWSHNWREGGYDAVTSLYVFLRIHSVSVSYAELAADEGLTGRRSFADILHSAETLGADAAIRKCTVDELYRMSLPAVIHLDSERDAAGTFLVLIDRAGDSCVCVNGSSGSLCMLDRDVLARQWSGYAMNLQRRSSISPLLWSGLFGCSFGLFLGRRTRNSNAVIKDSQE